MLSVSEFEAQLSEYLTRHTSTPQQDTPLHLSLLDLLDLYPEVGAALVKQPLSAMGTIKQVVLSTFNTADVRITSLPLIESWSLFDSLPKIEQQGRLIGVQGKITRASQGRVRRRHKTWKCQRCKLPLQLLADDTQYGQIPKPQICQAIIAEERCRHNKFEEDEEEEKGIVYEDIQECKLQEPMERLQVGKMPRTMTVVLMNELVGCCAPGDDVLVIGVLRSRWRPLRPNTKCEGEFFLSAMNVKVKSNESPGNLPMDTATVMFERFWRGHAVDRIGGRNVVVDGVAPEIFGMRHVKLAILLTVIGGVSNRGEGHLLLVGDPGTGKSHMLRSASMISPKAIMVTGSGTSAAGLTVAAVRDSTDWHLEAGALVLADHGVCCIDEFTLLGTADRASIHESMEQQRLSVAKAGLVCSLPTRCSILAACNPQPKKSIDKCDTLSEATGIATPLLSRFDLIFVLRDVGGAETDPRIARHVLKHFIGKESDQGMWDTKVLKAYISCVRAQFTPTMTSQANDLIEAYFTAQRSHPLKDPARTTMRLREGLVRLSEAHARLMAQSQVLVHDAVVAIALCDASMAPASLFKGLLEKHWEDIDGCIHIVTTKLNKH